MSNKIQYAANVRPKSKAIHSSWPRNNAIALFVILAKRDTPQSIMLSTNLIFQFSMIIGQPINKLCCSRVSQSIIRVILGMDLGVGLKLPIL